MQIHALHHAESGSLTYLVWDPATRDAVIIDPVMDFDAGSVQVSTESLEVLYEAVESRQLLVRAVMDTHVHADHLSGMAEVCTRYGCPSIVGSGMRAVLETFVPMFDLQSVVPQDGSQFDQLLSDGETVQLGSLRVQAIHAPGHTPACTCFLIGDLLFTGDALFMPDFGTGRCDFPNGSAEQLYDSVMRKLYSLPDETRVFVGHDYCPGGRALQFETTIGESKKSNKQLRSDTEREAFVEWRRQRDSNLKLPRLIYQAIQVNINAGHLPAPSEAGVRYLKLPIGQLSHS